MWGAKSIGYYACPGAGGSWRGAAKCQHGTLVKIIATQIKKAGYCIPNSNHRFDLMLRKDNNDE